MKVSASSLDDLLHVVYKRLLASGRETFPGKGKAYEMTGAVLELTNPRARMSRTESRAVIFGWLGELLWYLAGNDELSFVQYYIKDYKADYEDALTVGAAYGPRLRVGEDDQLKLAIALLSKKRDTRRAVISIYQPQDLQSGLAEVPCTCTLQFLLRKQRLELITHMRSNDAFVGLPGDIFAFTMIQELVATALRVEPGRYKHMVGSLHLYDNDKTRAQDFLAEGFQQSIPMPIMPCGDQFHQVDLILSFERETRLGMHPQVPQELSVYWQDLATLLSIFRADKDKAPPDVVRKLREGMHSDAYTAYAELKQQSAIRRSERLAATSDLLFEEGSNA